MHWQKLHLTSFKLTRFQVESFPLVLEINVSFSFQMTKYHIDKKKDARQQLKEEKREKKGIKATTS